MQHEEKEAQRLAKRRLERERGRREATADMSEEFSEGEKGDNISDLSTHGESTKPRLPRINSAESMELWASQQKGNKLYLVLIRYLLKHWSLGVCFLRACALSFLCNFLLGKSSYSLAHLLAPDLSIESVRTVMESIRSVLALYLFNISVCMQSSWSHTW